jgi:hypothetical protein
MMTVVLKHSRMQSPCGAATAGRHLANLRATRESSCLRITRARLQQVCHSAQLAADVIGGMRHHSVLRGKAGCNDPAVLAPLVHRLEAVLQSTMQISSRRSP